MEYFTIKELILASEGQLVSKWNEETIVEKQARIVLWLL